MTLFEKAEKILKNRGWKQGDLASAIGVTPQRMSNWFQGTGQPKPYHLLLIARALGVSMEFLADDEMKEIASPEITAEEWEVLRMVREIGVKTARARLLQAPTVGIPTSGGTTITKTLKARTSNG